MDNKPKEVSLDEMREMAVPLEPMGQGWGALDAEEMYYRLQGGYSGDLFIFRAHFLADVRPVEPIRSRDEALEVVEYIQHGPHKVFPERRAGSREEAFKKASLRYRAAGRTSESSRTRG